MDQRSIRCPRCNRPKGIAVSNRVNCTWCGHAWDLEEPKPKADASETPGTESEDTGSNPGAGPRPVGGTYSPDYVQGMEGEHDSD